MIDPSDMEMAAMRACLAPLGEYVGDRSACSVPLADYSRDEVLTLIDVVVTAYQDLHDRPSTSAWPQRTVHSWRNVWRVRGQTISEGGAVLMLDFNHRPKVHEQISELIDAAAGQRRQRSTAAQLSRRISAGRGLRTGAPVRVPAELQLILVVRFRAASCACLRSRACP
jgi:hypothetical protein